MADIAQIHAALDENADWFVEQSVTQCAAWISAATKLIHRAEESKRNGQGVGASLRVNLDILTKEITFARKWYGRNRVYSSSRETGVDFTFTDERR